MSKKYLSAIKEIILNEATFNNQKVIPTFINFFYGINGTGKTTIARAISRKESINWNSNKTSEDYEILVYNQDFIDKNFEKYENLKGVFTVGEKNVKILSLLETNKKLYNNLKEEIKKLTLQIEENKYTYEKQTKDFQELCYSKTSYLRIEFPDLKYSKQKKSFLKQILSRRYTETSHNPKELKNLYDIAFDLKIENYPLFKTFNIINIEKENGYSLFEKPIISSSDTDFSRFMKAINATSWVVTGHNTFINTNGVCPYCQQKLPLNFELELAESFDKQYKADLDLLKHFKKLYTLTYKENINILKSNLQNEYKKFNLTEYKDKIALLDSKIMTNLQKIEDKINNPSIVITIENTENLEKELLKIIEEYNKIVTINNEMFCLKEEKQKECVNKIWQMFCYCLKEDVLKYNDSQKAIKTKITKLQNTIIEKEILIKKIESEITNLRNQTVDTLKTITTINKDLKTFGFKGFSLREKESNSHIYEVVRETGEIATNLSEGEKNFIAFLYFYYLIFGSYNNTTIEKDKIIVIDDPISSMDSYSLTLISDRVRELIKNCYEDETIKQIFILTHNIEFHTDITYRYTKEYEKVSFFKITKNSENETKIKLCIQPNPNCPTENENFNPIKNQYLEAWEIYKNSKSAVEIIKCMRWILGYYFIQHCDYKENELLENILESIKKHFAIDECDTRFFIAKQILNYLNTKSYNKTFEESPIESNIDIEEYRAVFKIIFEATNQNQHYEIMTRNR